MSEKIENGVKIQIVENEKDVENGCDLCMLQTTGIGDVNLFDFQMVVPKPSSFNEDKLTDSTNDKEYKRRAEIFRSIIHSAIDEEDELYEKIISKIDENEDEIFTCGEENFKLTRIAGYDALYIRVILPEVDGTFPATYTKSKNYLYYMQYNFKVFRLLKNNDHHTLIHFVEYGDNMFDAHTHGLSRLGFKELQIIGAYNTEEVDETYFNVQCILNTVAENIIRNMSYDRTSSIVIRDKNNNILNWELADGVDADEKPCKLIVIHE